MSIFKQIALIAAITCPVACARQSYVPASSFSPVGSSRLHTKAANAFTNLYVDYGGGIAVFKPGSTTPTRTITNGIEDSTGMAIDSKGYLYVSNEIENAVSVYAPKRSTVLRTLVKGIQQPGSVALDSEGDVYIANCYACSTGSGSSGVAVYGPGGAQYKRKITKGISEPYKLAFDSHGALYVINGFPTYDVAIYPAGAKAPKKTISAFTGVQAPDSLLFDDNGDLFLGVSGSANGKNAIRVYPPQSTKPDAFIRQGIKYPGPMAIDSSGRLYVVNSNPTDSAQGSITVYSLASHKLIRTITDGVANPSYITLDSAGRIYVANWGYSSASPSVTVYSSDTMSLMETIPLIWQPRELAFGP